MIKGGRVKLRTELASNLLILTVQSNYLHFYPSPSPPPPSSNPLNFSFLIQSFFASLSNQQDKLHPQAVQQLSLDF